MEKERKNIKLRPDLAEELNNRAERLGLIQYRLADALIAGGLNRSDEEIYELVKQLAAGSNYLKDKPPASG